jgi:hypothetical protein
MVRLGVVTQEFALPCTFDSDYSLARLRSFENEVVVNKLRNT